MSELISLNENSKQYNQYLKVGLTSFMLFLAGCGPVSMSNIDSISASSTVLSSEEASCNSSVSVEVATARENDAKFLIQKGVSIDEVRILMESFCAGLISP